MTKYPEEILLYLHKVGAATKKEIMVGIGIGKTCIETYTPILHEEGFISKSKKGSRNTVNYRLTDVGFSVAEKIIDARGFVPQKATPPQINKLAGRYIPIMGYQRNDGHKSVQSRGYI